MWRPKPSEVEAVRWDRTPEVLAVLEEWGAEPAVMGDALRVWGPRDGYKGALRGDWLVRQADTRIPGVARFTPEEFAEKFEAPDAGEFAEGTGEREACGLLLGEAQDAIEFQTRRADDAEAKAAAYENGVNWMTSCTSCAAVLDSCIAETNRREEAEARIADALEITGNFLSQYGHSKIPMFRVAQDLANSLRKTLTSHEPDALDLIDEEIARTITPEHIEKRLSETLRSVGAEASVRKCPDNCACGDHGEAARDE
jgi:hypothetical protein